MRLTWPWSVRDARPDHAAPTVRGGAVPAMWQQDVPHLLGSLRVASGPRGDRFVPALVLAEHSAPGLPLTSTDWLVHRGWNYVEPPVRMIPLADESGCALGHREGPLYLTPCEGADALWPGGHAAPAGDGDEWWRRVTTGGQRALVLIAQDLDLLDAGVRAGDGLLDSAAMAGRLVATTARLSPVRPAGRWQFDAADA